jgi:translation initiation factor IF-3
VRVIADDGEQLGVLDTNEAINIARSKELDLVEVSPNAEPPVCKIMDFGKYLYRQKKLEQKQKQKQKKAELKGIRIGFKTDVHDLEVKAKQARKFLEGKNTVKIVLVFKGREMSHFELARNKIVKFIESLADIADVVEAPKKQGYNLMAILNPKKTS